MEIPGCAVQICQHGHSTLQSPAPQRSCLAVPRGGSQLPFPTTPSDHPNPLKCTERDTRKRRPVKEPPSTSKTASSQTALRGHRCQTSTGFTAQMDSAQRMSRHFPSYHRLRSSTQTTGFQKLRFPVPNYNIDFTRQCASTYLQL